MIPEGWYDVVVVPVKANECYTTSRKMSWCKTESQRYVGWLEVLLKELICEFLYCILKGALWQTFFH